MTGGTTIRQACLPRLWQLADALGIPEPLERVTSLFDAMTVPWDAVPVSGLPLSDVSTDGSPAEFAVTLGPGQAHVQLAMEPMVTAGQDTFANRAAAVRTTMGRLIQSYSLRTDRWNAVAGIFLPRTGGQGHAAMLGAEINRDETPLFKVWFYPGVTGPRSAPDVVRTALQRLGCGPAWRAVVRHAPRGFDLDAPVLFSLDLTDGRPDRTKIYFRHYQSSPAGVVGQLFRYPGFDDGRAGAFVRAMTEDPDSPAVQPPVSCLSFHDTSSEPQDCTLYLPLWTGLAHDEAVHQRIVGLLTNQGIAADRYDQAVSRIASRPLQQARGIHSYLSWQPGDPPRMKLYCSPELHGINPA